MAKVPKHPSGQPIRRRLWTETSKFREPSLGSRIPRLRGTERDLSLVGFHRRLTADADDREDD